MRTYVALILEQEGRYLVERRKISKKLHPGTVVFPAGKVEKGESDAQALKREMKEELDITIHSPYKVYQDTFDGQTVIWYGCKGYEGNIKMHEAAELLWIGPDEIDRLSFDNSRAALAAYNDSRIQFK